MTTDSPSLFDTSLLARRRDRANALGFHDGADFLYRTVAEILTERLDDVTRSFDAAVLVGTGGAIMGEALRGRVTTLQQLELSPARSRGAGVDPVPTLDPLPVPQESCDLIVSALELHWADDPVGQLIQMRRVLHPDGLMLAAMFGGETLYELRAALAQAESDITGGLSLRVAPMAEIRDLGGLLQRAGFALPVADSERLTVSYTDPIALMHDLRRMGETNVMTARRRVAMRRDVLRRACDVYVANFGTEDGRIPATFEIVFLTGWAPHESQQKPLRPGSARARLADALGTAEISAGDKAPAGRTRKD